MSFVNFVTLLKTKLHLHFFLKYLFTFSFSSNDISSVGTTLLFETLKECKADVESILLNSCDAIDNASVPFMIKYIESSNIIRIDINDTKIDQKNILLPPLLANDLRKGLNRIFFIEKFVCFFIYYLSKVMLLKVHCREIDDEILINMCSILREDGCKNIDSILLVHLAIHAFNRK